MSLIDSLDFDIMHGLPQLLRERVEIWQVPGIDGYGAQKLGQGDGEFDLVTVSYVSTAQTNADANTLISDCVALQGSVVTVTDDWGDAYNNVLVVRVDASAGKQPVVYQGNAAIRVEIRWRMLRVSENFL